MKRKEQSTLTTKQPSYYYQNQSWLISEHERMQVLNSLAKTNVNGLKKISRKDHATFPINHSILFSKDKTPYILHKGKENLLGKGFFGKVKVGQELVTGEFVAVKIQAVIKGQKAELIQKEKEILHKLNLLKGAQSTDLKKYLIQPLIVGGKIFKFPQENLQNINLNPDGLKRFLLYIMLIENLLSEMHKLHEKNILHRDIKPDNILFLPTGECRLVDFGLSEQMQGNYVTVNILGEFAYLSEKVQHLVRQRRMNPEIDQIIMQYPFSFGDDYHAMYLTLKNLNLLDNLQTMAKTYFQSEQSEVLAEFNNFLYPINGHKANVNVTPMSSYMEIEAITEELRRCSLNDKTSLYDCELNFIKNLKDNIENHNSMLEASYHKIQNGLAAIRGQIAETLHLSAEDVSNLIHQQIESFINQSVNQNVAPPIRIC